MDHTSATAPESMHGFLTGRCPRAAQRLVAACLGLFLGVLSHSAVAEVVLSTEVQKVETLLDAAGNVERRLTPAAGVQPGDELRYTITVSNKSAVLVTDGRVVVTNPVPEGTAYVPGSAGGADCLIEYSSDGESFAGAEAELIGDKAGQGTPGEAPDVNTIRWTLQRDLAPGGSHNLFFHVRMDPEATL